MIFIGYKKKYDYVNMRYFNEFRNVHIDIGILNPISNKGSKHVVLFAIVFLHMPYLLLFSEKKIFVIIY